MIAASLRSIRVLAIGSPYNDPYAPRLASARKPRLRYPGNRISVGTARGVQKRTACHHHLQFALTAGCVDPGGPKRFLTEKESAFVGEDGFELPNGCWPHMAYSCLYKGKKF